MTLKGAKVFGEEMGPALPGSLQLLIGWSEKASWRRHSLNILEGDEG